MEEVLQQMQNLWEGPDQTDHYPPPAPPNGKKSDIFDPSQFVDIDLRASNAPGMLLLSFSDLMAYLTKDLSTDLQKLRSIFVWMGTKEMMDESKYTEDLPVVTPYWNLQMIAKTGCDHTAITSCFVLLCRLAGLPCLIIKGYDKQVRTYEVGEKLTKVNSQWTAVYVDGSWRLVDPVMAFTGVTGGSNSDWVLLEDSGQAVRERTDATQAVQIQYLNEYYFLTDPEDFIYFCYPEDPAWQLLAEPWTLEKFVNTPQFSKYYLFTPWHLADKHEAVVRAPGGRCCIQMDQVPVDGAAIRYRLFFNEKKSKAKIPEKLQLDNYVVRTGTSQQQSVLTRLPVQGIYKLEILNQDKTTLCKIMINCTGQIQTQRRFPETPEKGFGFSQEAINAGLVDPSREEGVVVAREGEKIRFRFSTLRPLEVHARLVHSVLPSQLLDDRVTQEQEGDTVTVKVKVPWEEQNPEFSLQVDAREKNSKDEFVNVLNYLLTPDKQLVSTIKDPQQHLRDELTAAIADQDLHRLEIALREFRAGHVQDQVLAVKAFTRLYDLHRAAVDKAKSCETELATALQEADTSQVAYMLHRTDWLRQAQEALRRMRRLSSVKHEVKSLSGRQVSEVQTYNHPHPGVRAAIVAAYTLLGEKKSKLKKWSYVQSLLRQHGRQSIMQRIQNHDVSTIDKRCLQRATALLNISSAEEIRAMSVGAAAFYNWSKAVVESADKKDNVSCIQNAQADSEDEGNKAGKAGDDVSCVQPEQADSENDESNERRNKAIEEDGKEPDEQRCIGKDVQFLSHTLFCFERTLRGRHLSLIVNVCFIIRMHGIVNKSVVAELLQRVIIQFRQLFLCQSEKSSKDLF